MWTIAFWFFYLYFSPQNEVESYEKCMKWEMYLDSWAVKE